MPGLYYLGDFEGGAVYGFFAADRFHLVDAPGGAGLVDFIRTRLDALGLANAAPAAVLLTSAGPEATAGLRAIVEAFGGMQVVAPAEGLNRIQSLCPPRTRVIPAEAWAEAAGFPVTVIPLGGRGAAPIAYHLIRDGKSVLFSGRIPVHVREETVAGLIADFMRPGASVQAYAASLDRLGRLRPDVWLPAVPWDGQNANLYDRQWALLLEDNRQGLARLAGL